MRFTDFYNHNSPAISFEVFPPKSDEADARLKQVLPELIALAPHFMTVTYGAMGTTQKRTLEIAAYIKRTFEIETACHLTCVGASRAELDDVLARIYDSGIRNIVALRGDPPKGETEFTPPKDGLSHGDELVEHIHAFTERTGRERFGIAVAGYPEKHVEAADFPSDIRYLRQKVDAGGDCVVTQLFYDNADFFEFEQKARAAGIEAPIVPGLLPIVSVNQIRRISSMCGARIPDALHHQLDDAQDDDDKAMDVGVRWCAAQARELIARGVPGIHFYVLNRAAHMKRIMDAIR